MNLTAFAGVRVALTRQKQAMQIRDIWFPSYAILDGDDDDDDDNDSDNDSDNDGDDYDNDGGGEDDVGDDGDDDVDDDNDDINDDDNDDDAKILPGGTIFRPQHLFLFFFLYNREFLGIS